MHLDFRRLTDDDLPLLHGWLNEPGVVRWWEGDDVSWDAVVRDYGSASDPSVEHWLATVDGRPVGWLQCYATADHADNGEVEHWWARGVHRSAAGIDYLVGDPADRGRGLGSMMIQHFEGEDGTASVMCLDRAASTQWWASFFDHAYVDTWSADGAFAATDQQVGQLQDLLGLDPGCTHPRSAVRLRPLRRAAAPCRPRRRRRRRRHHAGRAGPAAPPGTDLPG